MIHHQMPQNQHSNQHSNRLLMLENVLLELMLMPLILLIDWLLLLNLFPSWEWFVIAFFLDDHLLLISLWHNWLYFVLFVFHLPNNILCNGFTASMIFIYDLQLTMVQKKTFLLIRNERLCMSSVMQINIKSAVMNLIDVMIYHVLNIVFISTFQDIIH